MPMTTYRVCKQSIRAARVSKRGVTADATMVWFVQGRSLAVAVRMKAVAIVGVMQY